MKTKYKVIIPTLLGLIALVALVGYLKTRSVPVLHPAGVVGQQELHLIIFGLILAVIVVVPTFALAIYIAVKYREENHTSRTKYKPDFDHSRLFESLWWGIPIVIIGVLSVVAWRSAHSLDPYKALASTKKPLTVQVVALDWKWLFIYPDQKIASVNLAEIPVGTSVDFHVTSDTIMNSFWVPSLGGQIYAMPGMDTQLHEMTNKPGSYFGSPANIAGHGFSRMDFTVRAASQTDFDAWVKAAQRTPMTLTSTTYAQLAKPSDNAPVAYYKNVPNGFYDNIVMKYMMPMPSSSPDKTPMPTGSNNQTQTNQNMNTMPGMNMNDMPGMNM